MDFLRQERERGITIKAAAVTFDWKQHRINLLDTPGHVDFTIEVERAIRVLDGAVAIFDGLSGVEAQTETVWRQVQRYQLPVISFVNKLDRDGANFHRAVDMIQEKLRVVPFVTQLPVYNAAGKFDAVFDIPSMQLLTWKDAKGLDLRQCPLSDVADTGLYEKGRLWRTKLVESLADSSDAVAEELLALEDPIAVSERTIRTALRSITISAQGLPVLCGAAYRNIGVQPLLDAIVSYLPSPAERPFPTAISDKGQRLDFPPTSRSLCALAFKLVHDAQRGPLVYARVYSGALQNRTTIYNQNRDVKERITKLLQMKGAETIEVSELTAGSIGAIVGLKHTVTGDTLVSSTEKRRFELPGLKVPPPVFFCAIEPASSAEEKPLLEALECLQREDPTFHTSYDSDTGQILVKGMGELHLEIIKDRLLNHFKVNADMGKVRISYRETPLECPSEPITFTYEREIAGKRAFARLVFRLECMDDYSRNDLQIDVSSHRLENQPISVADIKDSLLAGLRIGLDRGPLSSSPLAGVRVICTDVELNSDSSTLAVRACAGMAVAEALRGTQMRILEPWMKVEVTLDPAYVGPVMSDLSGGRMGHILSMDMPADRQIITAEVPLSQLIGYSTALRSQTAGNASFFMEYAGYKPVSHQQTATVLAELGIVQ